MIGPVWEEGDGMLPEGCVLACFPCSNRVGTWTTTIYAELEASGELRLSATSIFPDADPDFSNVSMFYNEVADAVECFDALADLRDVTCESWHAFDWDEVADRLYRVSPEIAEGLRGGEAAIERMREEQALARATERAERIAPFQEVIDRYVLRISDQKRHYPGAGRVYPSRRQVLRRFLEDHVGEHGFLPVGTHHIPTLGAHDFSDLHSSDAASSCS